MKELEELLDRYKHIQPPDATIKQWCIESIYKYTGIHVGKTNLKIKEKTIYIQTSSVEKNEIRLYQKEIITNINREVGEKNRINSIF